MRALFLFLVAANLAFFAWTQHLAPPAGGRDPQPLARQIAPERLKVLAPETESARSGEPEPPPGCVEWGAFAPAETARATEALAPLVAAERLAERRASETAGWWVFLPPQGSRGAAQKKVAELKALGVDDYFIVQEEGPARWAVSLGVFSTEEAARSHLAALKVRGVRTAQMGARETPVEKVWLQVRGADAALRARLTELPVRFPGTELRPCA